jgi:hypothetical protein
MDIRPQFDFPENGLVYQSESKALADAIRADPKAE